MGSSWAQPVIRNDGTGIVNAASYSAQGLPNASVAQGSIFTIFGSGLGPAAAVHASAFPLGTSLQGVSISISQGGITVPAIPLYASATQINAVMPSNAPIGLDSIVVTFNGQSSCAQCAETVTVQVVPSSFGIFTINQAGNGQGVFTTGANRMIEYTSPAAPGEVLNIWGTGLGAIPGSDAEPPAAGNVGSIIPTVYVGGVEVAAAYHGRSPCCSGVDQIQFQVPASVSGCNIPVAVQTGTVVSNFASIAVASPGHACVDPDGTSVSDFPNPAALGAISTGYVGLSRLIDSQVQTEDFFPFTTSTVTITEDYGYANFEKYPYARFGLTELPLQILNFGACSVYTFNQGETGSGQPFQAATPTFNLVPGDALDAGAAITINGPNGRQQMAPLPAMPPAGVGDYGADLGDSSGPDPLYLAQASYNVSGIGGKDVGPFSVSIQMPEQLAWTNQSSMNNISRANGVTLTWSGADPNGYVIISGISFSASGTGSAGFNCTAKAADNQFTVPAIVLLALPQNAINESDGVNTSDASLQVGIATAPVMFKATGLDLALAIASFSIAQSVNYQ